MVSSHLGWFLNFVFIGMCGVPLSLSYKEPYIPRPKGRGFTADVSKVSWVMKDKEAVAKDWIQNT